MKTAKATKDLADDAPEPDDDESQADYIDRCTDELTSANDELDDDAAEEACQMAWDNRTAARAAIKHKIQTTDTVAGCEYCLSDETHRSNG